MSFRLKLISVLRRLPHTRAFDRHLTDCAALEVIYRPGSLTTRHILKLDPLPPPMLRSAVFITGEIHDAYEAGFRPDGFGGKMH